MIKSIAIVSELGRDSVVFDNNLDREIAIDCSNVVSKSITSFDIEIVFSEPIISFRNHDYTWVDVKSHRIANSFCPKIVKLKNGFYVQSNANHGIWEVRKNRPHTLLWQFNPAHSNSLAVYKGAKNQKTIANAKPDMKDFKNPVLLFSENGAIELSRSKIPFTAVACFTDHCDFDTVESLQKQRIFFNRHQIKITKGFFLNHFSKRADNASWENDAAELQQWKDNGHELCYHSLSQSIKSKEESLTDFFSFTPPFPIKTWIDHGYQPYNLSLYQKEGLDEKAFAENLASKGISVLWNYIDSGTATSGVLNQLNTNDFTLQSFHNGIKNKSFKQRISLLIKNSIIHFYRDEHLIKNYSQLAAHFKKMKSSKSVGSFLSLAKVSLNLSFPLGKLILFWNRYKNKVYPLAKYQPVFFEHTIENQKFIIFQTLEFLDFSATLSPTSLDKLINEKGLFIGHTYFSVPMEYHDGKIFDKSGAINPSVAKNFEYLGQNIQQHKIWNPTLDELVAFWLEYATFEFGLDEEEAICIKNGVNVPHRNIT